MYSLAPQQPTGLDLDTDTRAKGRWGKYRRPERRAPSVELESLSSEPVRTSDRDDIYSRAPQEPIDVDNPRVLYFDPSTRSRALCKAGIIICWLCGLLCLAFGIWLIHEWHYLNLDKNVREILPLVINTLVTFINETLGYVHSNSLRWALQREGRLAFNSNLRLFTNSRTSKANAWYSNLFTLVCIILSYASTSFIFMGDVAINHGGNASDPTDPYVSSPLLPDHHTIFINGYAIITLAIGILGQAVVASACLRSTVSSPTWSSSPLDTAAACFTSGALIYRPGRCLRSVHDDNLPASPTQPRSRQKSAYTAHKEVRIVFFSLWVTVALSLLWCGVLIAVIHHLSTVDGMYPGTNWAFFPTTPASVDLRVAPWEQGNRDTSGTMTLAVPWNVIGLFEWQHTKTPYVSFPSFCWAFALVCLLQAVMTLSLHCAELLVNVVRDEKTWRKAGHNRLGGGLSRAPINALHALLTSGPGLALFLFKPVLHWVFGLAVSTYFSVGLVMRPPQIFYLALGAALLAAGVTVCSFWRAKGPQPATFGHLQTLVDAVDEWPGMGERMFWGRKEARFEYVNDIPNDAESGSREAAGKRGLSLRELRGEGVDSDGRLLLAQSERRVAHAGTSSTRLDEVRSDELYM